MVAKRDKAHTAELARELRAKMEALDTSTREQKLHSQLARERAKFKTAEAQRKQAVKAEAELRELLGLTLDMKTHKVKEGKIKPRERKSRVEEATAVLLYSDLHVEETVVAATVNGENEFNVAISRERNTSLAVGALWMLESIRSQQKASGFKVRDMIFAIIGDLITNSIHDDSMESNELGPAEALIEAKTQAIYMINALLTDPELERIHIPCCHGNHDRMTKLIRHGTKAANSLALILYADLAQHYASEPRVTFQIAAGSMEYVNVYGHDIRFTHGDDVRYGGGIGGLTIPLRKKILAWNNTRFADITNIGHFHQVMSDRNFVVNGSMIGYNAYAQAIGASWEPPAQAFYLLDKRHGKRLFTPLFVEKDKAERW